MPGYLIRTQGRVRIAAAFQALEEDVQLPGAIQAVAASCTASKTAASFSRIS